MSRGGRGWNGRGGEGMIVDGKEHEEEEEGEWVSENIRV